MNNWDDNLSSTTSSKTIFGTSEKSSTDDEIGIKESVVPGNASRVLDDILKEADQLIYDLDDVPLFEIEAEESIFLENIRQYFETDAEEDRLIDEIRRHFGNDAEEGISAADLKPFGIDGGENNSPENTGPCFETNLPGENTLERDARDVLNNILMKIRGSVFLDEGLSSDKYKKVPAVLSNEKAVNKSLFLKKWKSVEFQPPMYSTNFMKNGIKIIKGVCRNEPCSSVEGMEKGRNEWCSATKTEETSLMKIRGTVSCSNTPRVITPSKTVEEPFPFFSAKNSHFTWKQCAKMLDEDDMSSNADREIYSNEFCQPNKHLKHKTRKCSITRNKKISTDRNKETVKRKSDASSKVTISRKTVQKSGNFLKAKFPEKTYISLPVSSTVIVCKEAYEKTSKTKISPESEVLFPNYFKVTCSRETLRDTPHSSKEQHHHKTVSPLAPVKTANSKEFLTKDNDFDWEKWLEAYDSEKDVLPALPKFRIIKHDRHFKSACNRFLSLFTCCLCIPTGKKK